MKEYNYTRKIVNFLVFVLDKKQITKKTQPFYAMPFNYYTMIWYLRDRGLIEESGLDNNGQKIWVLTEQGRKIAELLKAIRNVENEIEKTKVGEKHGKGD